MRKTLGESLVESNVISNEQLDQALAIAKKGNERLGSILIRLGFATEDDICRVLSQQLGFEYVRVLEENPDKSTLSLVKPHIAQDLQILPLRVAHGVLIVAMANPLDIDVIDKVSQLTGKPVEPVLARPSSIQLQITKHYFPETQVSANVGASPTKAFSTADPTVYSESIVQEGLAELINEGVKRGAKFIHLEPTDSGYNYRYRVQGNLTPVVTMTPQIANSLSFYLKSKAHINFSSQNPQSGRLLWHINNVESSLNIKTIPTSLGHYITIQISGSLLKDFNLQNIGLIEEQKDVLEDMLAQFAGVTIVCGTHITDQIELMYAFLNHLKDDRKHIITIEDPIHNKLDGIYQSQANIDGTYNLPGTLRSVIQVDPDVILVSQLNDKVVGELAMNCANSGVKIITSLMAEKPLDVFLRLREMGVDRYLTAMALNGIVYQRMANKLCDKCKQSIKPNDGELKTYGIRKDEIKDASLFNEVGCSDCHDTGHSGQVVICELFMIDDELKALISSHCSIEEISNYLDKSNIKSLRNCALNHLNAGSISLSEFKRIV